MASPIALGWHDIFRETDAEYIITGWEIALYSIYEDKKGILRWKIEKVLAKGKSKLAVSNEFRETFRMHSLDLSDVPILTGARGWANTLGLNYDDRGRKLDFELPNDVEPNSACTKKQLYLLFPELEKLKMPFPVMKDYIKERL